MLVSSHTDTQKALNSDQPLQINAKAEVMAKDYAGKTCLEVCKARHPELSKKLDNIMNGPLPHPPS